MRTSVQRLAAYGAVVCLAAVWAAQATTIDYFEITTADDFTPGDGTAGADCHVRRYSWSQYNFGGTTALAVKNESTHTVRKTYVRFDLTTICPHELSSLKRCIGTKNPIGDVIFRSTREMIVERRGS